MKGARAIAAVGAAAVLSACGGGGSPPASDGATPADALDAAADAPPAHGYSLPDLANGYSFFLQLPPSFSPFLPLSGEEATREPPSDAFYDPTSPYFFSYAFIWWLTGTPDLSTGALTGDLETYYTGLCPSSTVAVTLGDPAAASAPVDAGVLVARRTGTLEAGNCLGNPVPVASIETSTYDCPDHTALIVVVSPQPASSQVWADLVAVRDGFTCW